VIGAAWLLHGFEATDSWVSYWTIKLLRFYAKSLLMMRMPMMLCMKQTPQLVELQHDLLSKKAWFLILMKNNKSYMK
jgi:hypothetical protein